MTRRRRTSVVDGGTNLWKPLLITFFSKQFESSFFSKLVDDGDLSDDDNLVNSLSVFKTVEDFDILSLFCFTSFSWLSSKNKQK